MLSIKDIIYCKMRKKEVRNLKRTIKYLKVDTFYEALTKGCWKFGIQYSILAKNNDTLEIKLCRGKKGVVIKFHKTLMVFMEDYERFLAALSRNSTSRGIYITTGVFEYKIINSYRRGISFDKKVKLEDMFSFGRGQIGLWGKSEEILSAKDLKLYKYLP